jgi:pteridine reductase
MNNSPTALVTGGSKRVGAAIVRTLATSGFDVLFTHRNSAAEATALVQSLESANTRVRTLQVDLESPDAVVRLVEWTQSQSSRLDVLVNNASLYLPDRVGDYAELSRRHQQVNHIAPVALTRSLSPLLKTSRGHVANMIDITAARPMPGYLAYCTSKAALASATIALARELAPEVTVNGISPGVVDWPDQMPLDEREAYLIKVPLKRAGTPEDVARLVRFLVTEGTYITGAIIPLDGGRSVAP